MRDNTVILMMMAGLIVAVFAAVFATWVAVRLWDVMKKNPHPLEGVEYRR